MKIEITARISEVGEIKQLEKTTVQEVILTKKWHNETTDETEERHYPVGLSKDQCGTLKVGDRVKMTGYLNGRKAEGGRYFLTIYARKLEIDK